MQIARVIINLSLDRTFDYLIPDGLRPQIALGSKVSVPFGNSQRQGYVVGFSDRAEVDEPKPITELLSERSLIPEPLLRLADWMADYYCCSREAATHALLPAVVRAGKVAPKTQKVCRLRDGLDAAAALTGLGARAKRQAELVRLLVRSHTLPLSFVTRNLGISATTVKALVAQEILVIEEETQARDPFANMEILPSPALTLNDEQRVALDVVKSCLDDDGGVVLLFGVTGSGKTEVYLQAINICLERGQSAIVLVPEIALTPQTTERFRARFGDQVSVLHSGLSEGERFDEWTRINEGRVSIAVGARSAVFSPFRNLGLIVVDEEHEPSYKQDHRAPRYHARDLAVIRGRLEGATVVLGTATPSLESRHNVACGKYKLATMMDRVDDCELPTMRIIDMCEVASQAGQPQILSQPLAQAIDERLVNGEQTMLFLNRRGYATQLQCLRCGFVAECPHCSANFTYHRDRERLMCHLCGEVQLAPTACPKCQDSNIRLGGLGTQKIQSVVHGRFPQARVLRMDSDTMTRKDSYRIALSAFRAGEYDILIGTQMIAKGLHFPNVTLVGIVFADMTLNMPDLRAGERTFQLIVQVAGRAGRGDLPGHVIIQTYTPFHPVLSAAVKQDFEMFYDGEIGAREQLKLPPFTHAAMVTFSGEDEGAVASLAAEFHRRLTARLRFAAVVTRPVPAMVARRANVYYYQLLARTERIVSFSRLLKQLDGNFGRIKNVRIAIDIDPQSIL